MGVQEHKFKRYVELRWLILLPCLERIHEQWETLLSFVNDKQLGVSVRAKRILDAIRNPDTRKNIQFVIYALTLSKYFEMHFQTVTLTEYVIRYKLFKILLFRVLIFWCIRYTIHASIY
jgi:hypothetical protein